MLPKDFYEDVKSVCIRESRNTDNVFLSIAIPTYKRNEFLEECIDSAINQDMEGVDFNYEIIVINNDPEADMSYFIEKYKDIDNISFYVNEKDIWVVGNMNRGAMLAKGKFVAYLHDDDLLKPNYLKEMGKFLRDERYKGAICYITGRDVVWLIKHGSAAQRFIGFFKQKIKSILFRLFLYGKVYELTPELAIHAFVTPYSAPSCGTAFDKEKFFQAEGWTFEGGMAFDWHSFMRFNEQFKIYRIKKNIGIYRFAVNETLKKSTQLDFCINDLALLNKKYKSESLNKYIEKYKKLITYIRLNGLAPDEEREIYKKLNLEKYTPSKWELWTFRFKKFCYVKFYTIFKPV